MRQIYRGLYTGHVSVIIDRIEAVLLELRNEFGESLTREEVVFTIGPRTLVRDSIRANNPIKRTNYGDIVELYREALKSNKIPPSKGDGI